MSSWHTRTISGSHCGCSLSRPSPSAAGHCSILPFQHSCIPRTRSALVSSPVLSHSVSFPSRRHLISRDVARGRPVQRQWRLHCRTTLRWRIASKADWQQRQQQQQQCWWRRNGHPRCGSQAQPGIPRTLTTQVSRQQQTNRRTRCCGSRPNRMLLPSLLAVSCV